MDQISQKAFASVDFKCFGLRTDESVQVVPQKNQQNQALSRSLPMEGSTCHLKINPD